MLPEVVRGPLGKGQEGNGHGHSPWRGAEELPSPRAAGNSVGNYTFSAAAAAGTACFACMLSPRDYRALLPSLSLTKVVHSVKYPRRTSLDCMTSPPAKIESQVIDKKNNGQKIL